MRINFNNDEYLDIFVIRRGAAGISYDCALEVILKSNGFNGTNKIWVEGSELQGFIEELKNLDKTLKGRAILTSESPGEFLLDIKSVDNIGHFVIYITIGKSVFIENKSYNANVSNAFPLESQKVSKVCIKLIKFFTKELE